MDSCVEKSTHWGNSAAEADGVQEALRESEERYRQIVETANEGIWTICADATVTFVNRRLATMLGYAQSEMLGQSFLKFLPPSYHQRGVDRLQRAQHGISESSEGVVVHKNGTELWVLIKTSPMRDSAGGCAGILAMITDRTRSREVEEALRKSVAEYRQIVESTTDGIIKVDSNATIVFVNARYAAMLGYQPHELIGTALSSLVAPSERTAVARALQARAEGVVASTDTIYLHKDGHEISVNIAGAALYDEHGQSIGTLGVVRDTTEQRKLQAQLIVSDRMASVGTLAAGVAHEINNPLAAVVANLEYVDEGIRNLTASTSGSTGLVISPSWLHEHVEQPLVDAREAAQRVQFIVRDLNIFSRRPADELRVPVNVTDVIESSLRMSWNEIRHRAHLVKQLAEVPLVSANEARLGQVFLNLIVNAAQSIPVGHMEQHEIRVSSRHEGARVVVEISDTGAGIAPENIERIFDAFYTTKPVGVGTGLGLAICQRIVVDMGGTLTVASTLGAGSTFRVDLPIATDCARQEAAPKRPVGQACSGRVLVVDDDALVARGVQRALEAEYDVVACTSAWAALALIVVDHFDLILCDLMMPDMTGMDLHAEVLLMAPEQVPNMMFMTGGAFTESARTFIAENGISPIEKPFSAEMLRSAVCGFLGATASAP